MIICEVLGVSPYELLSDAESRNPRECRQPDAKIRLEMYVDDLYNVKK